MINAAIATFFGLLILVPIAQLLARQLGFYAIVPVGRCFVYVLFGNVVAVLDEPGIHCLLKRMGLRGLIVNTVGKCHELDMRLDRVYLRSQAVNSEEGAPMGIGIWYEMYVSDPVPYLFNNTDPAGSLAANVSNSTVRCLSNLPLDKMLVDRHTMSRTVRDEVSPKSHQWGYKLGSVYIRKVHFRDADMIAQIESKVVNRLRQVTAAIKQDGANQVSIITTTSEKVAAVEFARAQAIRPQIVGEALQRISEGPEVIAALFEILETEKVIAGGARVSMVPDNDKLIAPLMAAERNSPATTTAFNCPVCSQHIQTKSQNRGQET
jgi:hypothetical protein